MKNSKLLTNLDLSSIGVVVFFILFSIVRFVDLPQFFDGYYHLSCANAFQKSGGWVGIDWWSSVPDRLVHIYPPIYHFILVFLKTIGLAGINAIRLTESAMVPLFLFVLWFLFKKLIGSEFSFLLVLIASSFFSFFTALSGNVPATIAMIGGIISWYFLKNKKIELATIFLVLAFYTHSGIPWIFLISILAILIFDKEYRILAKRLILASLGLSLPIIYHQFINIGKINLSLLGENKFTHFNIFVLIVGFFTFFYYLRRKNFFTIIFSGYCIGAMFIFLKYPYRFFSGQGMLGFIFLSAYLLNNFCKKFTKLKKNIFLICIGGYFFFCSATIDLNGEKPEFNLFNSTYYNLFSGNFIENIHFISFYEAKYHRQLLEVINENTESLDVIVSSMLLPSRLFSALANRPSSFSALGEVRSLGKDGYPFAKIIIWHKPYSDELTYWKDKLKLTKIYENKRAGLFLNSLYRGPVKPIRAKITFKTVFFILLFFFFLFIGYMLKSRN